MVGFKRVHFENKYLVLVLKVSNNSKNFYWGECSQIKSPGNLFTKATLVRVHTVEVNFFLFLCASSGAFI